MRFLLLTLEVFFTIDFLAAIECQFRFIERDKKYPGKNEANTTTVNQLSNLQPFKCDEPVTTGAVMMNGFDVVARVNDYFVPEDDEYESVEICQARKRTIYPKALNSITNQLIPIVNNNEIIQAIETEECLSPKQACSSYSIKLTKSICIQKYVKVFLKALTVEQRVYDEQFYFPSFCACDLIKVKDR